MLSLKDVQVVPRQSGIYSLIKDGEIVYIGRSRNMYTRVLEHILENKKEFDCISFLISKNSNDVELDIMENVLIFIKKPKYNKLVITSIQNYIYTLPQICKDHAKEYLSEDLFEFKNNQALSILSDKEYLLKISIIKEL